MNAFAAHLCDLRRSARLTQQQLAARIGVDRSVYAMYESGKLVPAPQRLDAICNQCSASPDARRTLMTEADP